MIRHEGNRTYRFEQNPLERAFAKKWKEENDRPNESPGVLAWSMGNGERPTDISQEQATVAASVIQWLGSPVGQRFLIDVLSKPVAKKFREDLGLEVKQR